MSFTCPDCLRTSNNPHDEIHKYCGNCHSYKDANLELSDFQQLIVSALHSEFPVVQALKSATAYQERTHESWQTLMLQTFSLFNASKLSTEQWMALDQVCGLTAEKGRSQ